ncbi:MAG: hypothetical protein CMF56_06530 [Leifsonia sp.]|nr:hypothetical protein [Leifsonia sp.]|tara:strand:+ start:63247 stop:64512 length:1266 start_codon:yes stop_codon:yes gene_type:complete
MSKLGALVRRLGLDNVPLHATATAESLALARILMLAIWIVYVVQDPVQSLTFLPQELFHAFGVFQLVPGTAWAALLTPTGLFALKSVLIGLFAWAMFGFRGARVAAAVALALVFVYLQVKKGFGGHWDHREMTLAYAHFLLLFTPAWDAFAVSRAARRPRREGVYRASLIALSLVVIIQYFFIGAARTFIGGPGIFLDGSLQNWIINRNLRPNPFGFDLGTAFLAEVWRAPLDLLFLGGTLLELVAFIVLFLRPGWLKIGFAIGFAVFHASIFLLMNVAFLENIVLILLFFDLAAPWRRARRGHNAPGVLLVDRARPAALEVAAFVRRFGRGELPVREMPASFGSPAGGLAFQLAGGSDVVTGQRARAEATFRVPGFLWLALWRTRRAGDRPLADDRSVFAAWFLGPRVAPPGADELVSND